MKAQLAMATLLCGAVAGGAVQAQPSVLEPLPALDVASYMGLWYQVLWYPNRFQRQCISDTTASYRDVGDGRVRVVNRCRTAEGRSERVAGIARPPHGVARIEGGQLKPAQLEVSFLPAWLRWTGIGWGDYWVIDRAPDGRYAIVSEGSREYLWVLSRKPALTAADDTAVRAKLQALGFELSKLEVHRHGPR